MSNNDVPKFLRLKDLQERGIAMTHQAVRHMQLHEGFPLGRLLGPGTKVWTVQEINEWLAIQTGRGLGAGSPARAEIDRGSRG